MKRFRKVLFFKIIVICLIICLFVDTTVNAASCLRVPSSFKNSKHKTRIYETLITSEKVDIVINRILSSRVEKAFIDHIRETIKIVLQKEGLTEGDKLEILILLDSSSTFNKIIEAENKQAGEDAFSIIYAFNRILELKVVTINNIELVLEKLAELKELYHWEWFNLLLFIGDGLKLDGLTKENLFSAMDALGRVANDIDWEEVTKKVTSLDSKLDSEEPETRDIQLPERIVKAVKVFSLKAEDLTPGEKKAINAFSNKILTPQKLMYFSFIKKMVNPYDVNSVCLYPGAGADISSVLLSTNATTFYFIDKCNLSYNPPWREDWLPPLLHSSWKEANIKTILHYYNLNELDSLIDNIIKEIRERRGLSLNSSVYYKYADESYDTRLYDYIKYYKRSFASTMVLSEPRRARKGLFDWIDQPTFLGHILEPFLLECVALGIDEVNVWRPEGADETTAIVTFKWQHPDGRKPKERKIVYIGNIDLIKTSLEEIELLPHSFNIYFEKAFSPHPDPYDIKEYGRLRTICSRLSENGRVVVDNYRDKEKLHFIRSISEVERKFYDVVPVSNEIKKLENSGIFFGHGYVQVYRKINKGLNAKYNILASSRITGKNL